MKGFYRFDIEVAQVTFAQKLWVRTYTWPHPGGWGPGKCSLPEVLAKPGDKWLLLILVSIPTLCYSPRWFVSNTRKFHRSPAQVGCMRQVLGPGALGRLRGTRWRGRGEGGSGWGTHVNPWLIHVSVWQKPLQYCKVISLQLIKINEKKKRKFQLPLAPQIHSEDLNFHASLATSALLHHHYHYLDMGLQHLFSKHYNVII